MLNEIEETLKEILAERDNLTRDKAIGKIYSKPPESLDKIHRKLDSLIDEAYGFKHPNPTDNDRIRFLIGEYLKATQPLPSLF